MPYILPALGKKGAAYSGFGDLDFKTNGIPSQADYIAQYCQKRNRPPIENMHFYMGFSIFRAASILQGVYKRAMQGNASAPDAERVGGFAQYLADKGWELVNVTPATSASLFPISSKAKALQAVLIQFMDAYVYPA